MNPGPFPRTMVAAALLLGAAGLAGAQTPGAWLHVRVDEGAKKSRVSVNLPVSVVEAVLEAAPEKMVSKGRVHLGHENHHMKVADLRRAWRELKATGDAELVTVEEEDQTVRVARAGDLVVVHVDKASGKESVRVEVPVDVVDALLSGEGEELNIRAAFGLLQKRRGDIVRVHDDEHKVRIWIDEAAQ